MADPTTTSTAMARATGRDEQAWQMRIAGHSLQAIADALAFTSTREVSAMIKRRLQQGRQALAESVDQATALEAERLDAQTRAVWPRVMQHEITHPITGAPELDHQGHPRRYEFDPKAHALALQIHDRRVKLFGLEKATKIEITGAGGGPIRHEGADLSNLSATELALLEMLHAKARGAAAGEGVDADTVDAEIVEPDEPAAADEGDDANAAEGVIAIDAVPEALRYNVLRVIPVDDVDEG